MDINQKIVKKGNKKMFVKRGLMVMECGHLTTFYRFAKKTHTSNLHVEDSSTSTKVFRSLIQCEDCWNKPRPYNAV